jgi:DNA-binding winged helix-turn-helix (wHTH) protein
MNGANFSKTEKAIFDTLAGTMGNVVSREQLSSKLKGSRPHTLDSHIMAIRKKLADSGEPYAIETVPRVGFILRSKRPLGEA